jgi:tRNA threonylcarbamoyladenosine biosynthesis protein TsaB
VIVLALDTCLSACSVAVAEGSRVLAHAREEMARGHQERLAPMAERTMADAGIGFEAIDRVAVTVGPGSFTGLRVGIAFAKGLAAARGLPLVGIGTLEALAAPHAGLVFPSIDAKRGQLYLQAFEDGQPLMAPDVLPVETAAARLLEISQGRSATLTGSGWSYLAEAFPEAEVVPAEGADARDVARLAAGRTPAPVMPLYLRAPDARLPR